MNETTAMDAKSTQTSRPRWLRWTVGLIVLAFLVAAGIHLSGSDSDRLPTPIAEAAETPKPAASQPVKTNKPTDEEHVKALIGRWKHPESYGDITLTLKPKGKGTMFVEFSTVYSFLVDDELLVDIVWEVKDGQCVFKSISGKPKAAFELVTKLRGKVREYKIIEVTQKRIVFFDKRKNEKKTWKRLPDKKKK